MFIKGTGIRSLLLAIEKVAGPEGLIAVKGAVAPQIRAQIEPTILASHQYPVQVSASLQVAIRDTIGKGSLDISYRLGVEAARIDFSGVYKIFLRALNYDSIWDRSERAWGAYNSQGEARWTERQARTAKGAVTGVSGFNRGLWYSVAGRMEGILLIAGARTASTWCVDPTPSSCRFQAAWVP